MSKKIILRNILGNVWILIVLVSMVSYFGGIYGDFVFDDNALIKNDKFYLEETNPLKCWDRGFWSDSRGGLYRPMTVFSYWLNVKLFGLNATMFRVVNLLLHIGVSFLVYFLAKRLRLGSICGITAALIYAAHPLHSEAVIPAFGRAELLCAAFFMLAFIFHIKEPGSWKTCFASGIFLLFSLWSKEHAIAFIPVCLLYDFLNRRAVWKSLVFKYSAYAICIAFMGISKYSAIHSIFPGKDMKEALVDNRLALCPAPERISSAIRIQGIALCKFAWPSTLSHDYSYAQILPSKNFLDPAAIATLLGFFGATLMLIWQYPCKRKVLIFLTGSYALCLIPAGNFIIPAGTIFAERLLYLPSAWLCLFLSLIFIRFLRLLPFPVSFIIVALVAGSLAFRSNIRCYDWHDRMTLALAGVKTSPLSVKTWGNLAVQLEENGQYPDAVSACNMAIGIYPEDPSLYLRRGTYYSRMNMNMEAENDFRKSLSLDPKSPQASVNLAIIQANTGRTADSKETLKTLLLRDPSQKAAAKMLESLERR